MDAAVRRLIRQRAGGRCEYCKLPAAAVPVVQFHADHVVAQQHGGTSDVANLAYACDRCNLYKGTNLSGVDPETQQIVRIFNPRQDAWQDHFAMVGMEFIGATSIGRATAALLQFNAESRLRLRTELAERGEFDLPQ